MGKVYSLSRIPFSAAGRNLHVPLQPTPEDEDWALRNRPCRPKDFSDTLAQAVTEHRHWRVSHLVEKHFPLHYVGRDEVDRLLDTACKMDNVVAVRLLLQYAEKSEGAIFTDASGLSSKDLHDLEVRRMAFEALTAAARCQNDGVMDFALKTLDGLSPDQEKRGVRHFSFVYQAGSAIAAAANNGRMDYLDKFLEHGAWPDRFREVYAVNLMRQSPDNNRPRMRLNAQAFEPFMQWMTARGIADPAFIADPVNNWSQAPVEYLVYLKPDAARMFNAKHDLPQFDMLNRTLEEGGMRLGPGPEKSLTDIFNLESVDGCPLAPARGEAMLEKLKTLPVVQTIDSRPAARFGKRAAPVRLPG